MIEQALLTSMILSSCTLVGCGIVYLFIKAVL
jgi:hypothetical protein